MAAARSVSAQKFAAGKALRFRRRDGQRLTFAGGRFGLFRKQRTAPRFRNAEPPDVPGGAARRT